MNLSLRSAALALAWLRQNLQSLHMCLEGWVPHEAPALVPIPIRTGRQTRGPVGRDPYRGG